MAAIAGGRDGAAVRYEGRQRAAIGGCGGSGDNVGGACTVMPMATMPR